MIKDKLKFEGIFIFFGGQNKLAGELDVSTQAIHAWRKRGFIPAKQAVQIEKLTDSAFSAVDMVYNMEKDIKNV